MLEMRHKIHLLNLWVHFVLHPLHIRKLVGEVRDWKAPEGEVKF